jgi:type I restriction enzyme R subunit
MVGDSFGGEDYTVKKPLIEYVQEKAGDYTNGNGEKILLSLGWEFVSPDEALRLRGGETGIIFKDIFISQMQKLNPDFMNRELAEELIKSIERLPANIEGNLSAWEYIKGLKTVFVPKEKRERNVIFIDTNDIDKNIFQVTEEFSFTNGDKTIRADVVFLINGVPVLLIETKSANKLEGMSEALDQIRRYHLECPEMMVILQVYAITHIVRFYYGATWNVSERYLFNWKEEVAGNFEMLVKKFLDRKRIVKILMDYILFTRQDDELKKVVLRPHQMRAVDMIVERANSEKKRGLIWHTQGSGKTYTMIVAAQKIIENPIFENPTVLMLVDRNELETQLFNNLDAVGIKSVKIAQSKRHLQELLAADTRGLIVSMIHKFEDMPANINMRKNIFVFIDEAHRTIGGKLGDFLMGALPNATYIGFTGTPIDKTSYGKGTFLIFGKDDPPKGYLDKYSIAESIEDGTTVPLHYSLAPNELRVDRDTLDREFLNLKEAEGVSNIEDLNKILEKAVNLRNMLKNHERIRKVAQFVVDHYRNFVEPMGYKAFLVAVDREACALYKSELDKLLPKDYSRVVYSPFYNDLPELSKYHLTKDEEKRIRKAFKKPNELPKILIVTDKLLTGFDAPILYCMYLDKPMRDHVLLQAIARVNRPYEDETGMKKPSGLILDFIGIFENLEKALAFDSSDIEGVVHDIEVLKLRFSDLIKIAKEEYLNITEGKSRDKAVESVLEYFLDEQKRLKFYEFYKEIESIYEIISPDAFLRPYINDFETLTEIYKLLKEAYGGQILVDREFMRKTAELVKQHIKSGEVKLNLDVYEINEETLKRIHESKASDTEKVINLWATIRKAVQSGVGSNPYLISIGEKAERIANSFLERQKTTQDTLEELKKIIEEVNAAQKEQIEKNMNSEVFTVYWLLKEENIDRAENIANNTKALFKAYPYWKTSEAQERELRQELYGFLLTSGAVDASRVPAIVNKIIDVLKKRPV